MYRHGANSLRQPCITTCKYVNVNITVRTDRRTNYQATVYIITKQSKIILTFKKWTGEFDKISMDNGVISINSVTVQCGNGRNACLWERNRPNIHDSSSDCVWFLTLDCDLGVANCQYYAVLQIVDWNRPRRSFPWQSEIDKSTFNDWYSRTCTLNVMLLRTPHSCQHANIRWFAVTNNRFMYVIS